MKTLELQGVQTIGTQPDATGPARLCHKLTETPEGELRAARGYLKVAELPGRPIAVDRRGGLTNIFVQEDDGTLLLALSLSDDNKSVAENKVITRMEKRVVQGAFTGDFLVLRDSDGKLYYLHYSEGEYFWLGSLPEAPGFELRAVDQVTLTADVPAMSFTSVVDDLRPGLSEANRERVGKTLLNSLRQMVADAHMAGYRALPVMVRVAWRLNDGSLLHVSEPQRISGVDSMPGDERVTLPLAYNDKGYTGTEAGSLRMQAYKLKVLPLSALPQAWSGVVKGVEIWVSEPESWLREGELPEFAQVASSTAVNRLSCTFPLRTEAEILAELPSLPMRRQLYAQSWGGEIYVPASPSATADEEMTGQSVPQACDFESLSHADALLGYSGFLHTVSGEDVRTSMRGNPFVTQGFTKGVGGKVACIWPSLGSGGAYTRQYIYLATDHGLLGLTLDGKGNHMNCRSLWPGCVESPQMGVPGASGLLALSCQGELVRIKDARVTTLLRQVKGAESIAYSSAFARIMLMDSEQSITLDEAAGLRAFTHDFTCRMLEGCTWRSLGWSEDRLGVVSLYDLNEPDDTLPEDALYEGDMPEPPAGGVVHRLCVPATGAALNVRVYIFAGRPGDWHQLTYARVKGTFLRGFELYVPAIRSRHRLNYRFQIYGQFNTINDPVWEK